MADLHGLDTLCLFVINSGQSVPPLVLGLGIVSALPFEAVNQATLGRGRADITRIKLTRRDRTLDLSQEAGK